MTGATPQRGAVLQFEVDLQRLVKTDPADFSKETSYSDETPMRRLRYIARTAINDTIRNGGTFVLIASGNKITMVQRPDAEDF